MKILPQKNKFEVENFDFLVKGENDNHKLKKNGDLLPDDVRALLVAGSNGGKTNLALTLILHPEGLRFKNLFFYTKTPNQEKMEYLKKVMAGVPEIKFIIETDNEKIISAEKIPKHSLIIFDDFLREKQSFAIDIFLRCRHSNSDCLYLTQSLTRVNRQMIRNNINILFVFNNDELTLNHIYKEFCIFDFDSFSEFQKVCKTVFQKRYDFLMIDLTKEKNSGKYRLNLDKFITFE